MKIVNSPRNSFPATCTVAVLFLIFFTSCQKHLNDIEQSLSGGTLGSGTFASLNLPYQEGMVILGQKKQNP